MATAPAPGLGTRAIDEITDAADTTVLRLSPLSIAGVTAVLSSHFGADPDPEFSSTVSEWTAGNPLLLSELLAETMARHIEATAAGADQVRDLAPESVGRHVQRRIAPLGRGARAVAEAVAVLGEDTEIERVAKLAELSRSPAALARARRPNSAPRCAALIGAPTPARHWPSDSSSPSAAVRPRSSSARTKSSSPPAPAPAAPPAPVSSRSPQPSYASPAKFADSDIRPLLTSWVNDVAQGQDRVVGCGACRSALRGDRPHSRCREAPERK